jgi:hypothetical protein
MKKKVLIGGVIVLGLAAGAMMATRTGWLTALVLGEEGAVKKRAEAYWSARVSGDMKAMAPYVHPLQQAVQQNDLLETRSYEITNVKVEGDEALVAIKAKYRVKMARTSSADRELAHDDRWVRYKGVWYHALHPVGFGEILQHGLGQWKAPTTPPPPATPAPATPSPAPSPAASSAPGSGGADR